MHRFGLIVTLLFATGASAQSTTWIGAATGDWFNAANRTNGVPAIALGGRTLRYANTTTDGSTKRAVALNVGGGTIAGGGLPVGGPVTYRFAEFDTITGATAVDVTGLFNVTGMVAGTPVATLTLDGAGGDHLTITFTPVPGPGASAVVLAGMAVLAWRRSRRSCGKSA